MLMGDSAKLRWGHGDLGEHFMNFLAMNIINTQFGAGKGHINTKDIVRQYTLLQVMFS